jgi:hypothetical protein
MISVRARRALTLATVGILATTSAASAQRLLQRSASIDLSSQFFAGVTPSDYGWNPVSVAFDGTNAYVGGWNSGTLSGNVGIVRVDNILAPGPTLTPLPASVFVSPNFRGINDMAWDKQTGALYSGHDAGGSLPSTITRHNPDGSANWLVNPPTRVFALGIDPVVNPGGGSITSGVAFLNQGNGRRGALATSDGSLLYTPQTFSLPTDGAIVNGSPTFMGTAWRSVAFDSEGNIALSEDTGFQYGLRVNENRFSTIGGGTLDATSSSLRKVSNDFNNVAVGVAIMEDVTGPGGDLVAFSTRGTADATTSVNVIDLLGNNQTLNVNSFHVRNPNGTITGVAQHTFNGDEDGLSGAFTSNRKNFAYGKDANNNPVLLVLSFNERRLDVYTLEPAWNNTGGGDWGVTGNWLAGISPNDSTQNARFGGAITAPSTVNLEAPKTVKHVKFDNLNRYTLSGSTLTLNSTGTALITVVSGNHTIASPLQVNKSARFTVPAGSTLTVSGTTNSGPGATWTKNGAGTMEVSRVRSSALILNEGTVKVLANGSNSGTSVVSGLAIAGGPLAPTAKLDLNDNDLVVNYAPADPSPFGDLYGYIRSGRNFGAWNGTGVNSSAAAADPNQITGLGLVEGSDYTAATGLTTFSGYSMDGTEVLVKYTYNGDTDLNGQIDFDDYARIDTSFLGGVGDKWIDGDSDYSGTVDFDDYALIDAAFLLQGGPLDSGRFGGGMTVGGVASGMSAMDIYNLHASMFGEAYTSAFWSLVPEPSSVLGLAALAALAGGRRRRNA